MMNKTSRFLTIGFSLLVGLSALWSCDKDSEQDDPEGTGIFIIRNGTTTPLYYLKAANETDTVFIDTFALAHIETYKEVESHATPAEFYFENGLPLKLYKLDNDSVTLVETYAQYPVTTSGWLSQKNDELEYGVTQYSLHILPSMLQ